MAAHGTQLLPYVHGGVVENVDKEGVNGKDRDGAASERGDAGVRTYEGGGGGGQWRC
jgi:hypothetical protein